MRHLRRALLAAVAAVPVLLLASSECSARRLADLIPGLYGGDGIFLATAPSASHTAHFALSSASAITRLNDQLATEVAIFPFSSSAGGFTFAYQEELGTFVRTTEALGPLFAEQAPTVGRGKVNLHLSYTFFKYHEFGGRSLSDLQVVARHDADTIGFPDVREQFENDVILIDVDVDVFVQIFALAATVGLTDRLDLGFLLPLVHVDMEVESNAEVVESPENTLFPGIHTFSGGPESPRDAATGDAFGVGDLVLRAKYQLLRSPAVDLAGALLAKLETGNERDFLGSGATTIRPFLVLSRSFRGSFTPHLNVGYEFNLDRSDENALEYAAGVAARAGAVTLLADLLGSHELDGDGVGDDIVNGSLGVKWNPVAQLILFGNVQFPLNDAGLRARATPTIGLEVTF